MLNTFGVDISTPGTFGSIVPGGPTLPATPSAPITPPAVTPPASPVVAPVVASPVTTPPATTPPAATSSTSSTDTDPNSPANLQKKILADKEQALKDAAAFNQKQMDIQNGVTPLSAGQQAQIQSLTQQFQGLIDDQEAQNTQAEGVANIRGYQKGAAEYDPTFHIKTIGAIASAGAAKIADFQTQLAGAVANMTQAFKDNNIKAIKASYDTLKAAQDDYDEELQNYVDKVQEAIKTAKDEKIAADKVVFDTVTKPIQDVAKLAAQNGASKATLSAINSATTVEDALAAAGDNLQTATGTLGDYLQYKRQAEAAGQIPISYDAYKAKEDQREANLAYSKAYATAKGTAAGSIAGQTTIPTNTTTKPYVDAFNSAAGGLTATQLKQAQATFNGLLASGDLDGAKAYIVRTAFAGANANEQTQAIGRYQALSALNDIQSLLKEASAKGAAPNLVTGNIANSAKKLGVSSNDDLNYISSRIQAELQTYRRAMTGVAFSPQETAQYQALFPSITNTDALNTTQLNALADALNSNNRATLSFYIGDSNYDKLYGPSATSHLPSSIVAEESAAQASVADFLSANPDKTEEVKAAFSVVNPQTGKPLTAVEFLQVFPEYAK